MAKEQDITWIKFPPPSLRGYHRRGQR